MSSTGDVYPCTSLISEEFLVGDVRERPMEDLWNDPQMTFISSFPVEKIRGYCRECQYFSRCRGACRGITFAHTHDLYASFPFCLKRVQPS